MSVIKETDSLAGFVRNTMEEKNLTLRDVERNSGKTITHSYVNKIKNGISTNPSSSTLRALARGLKVDEEKLFAIARGQNLNSEEDVERIELEAMYRKRKNLSPARKEAFRRILDMVDRELDRLYEEEQKEAMQ
jgi:transcriptional regulator with XRE-family HTH domain